jgi:hypothetical protein
MRALLGLHKATRRRLQLGLELGDRLLRVRARE